VALAALTLGAGCTDERVERADVIRARACACTEPACIDGEIAAFAQLDASGLPARYRPRLEAAARAIVDCVDRVYAEAERKAAEVAAAAEAGAGDTTPAAAPSPSPSPSPTPSPSPSPTPSPSPSPTPSPTPGLGSTASSR
jgi:hypothetical protein